DLHHAVVDLLVRARLQEEHALGSVRDEEQALGEVLALIRVAEVEPLHVAELTAPGLLRALEDERLERRRLLERSGEPRLIVRRRPERYDELHLLAGGNSHERRARLEREAHRTFREHAPVARLARGR